MVGAVDALAEVDVNMIAAGAVVSLQFLHESLMMMSGNNSHQKSKFKLPVCLRTRNKRERLESALFILFDNYTAV
jgi:hypothetical protein